MKYINFQALNKNFAQDLSFLSAFPNIEEISLGFSSGDTWDLAGLTSLTKLRKLSINGFDTKFEHLNILSGMPQLTELLFYDVKDLKTLDFVKNMPNLKTLHIEDCPILSLDGLKGSLSLTSLTLDGCHDLKDISALNTLTSLKTLDVAYIWNFDLNFTKLNNLTALSDVSITSDYLPALSGLSSVKKLFIYEVSNSYSFEPISNMHSLSELELRSYNWSEKPDMVSFLAKLPKLKSLIFSYGCLANTGEYSDVFSLPQVTKIKIKPVNTGSSYLSISMSRLKNNHVLKELDTGGVQIYNTDMPDSSVVNLGEYADEFLGHFPKLKKLNVSSSHIDSLEFVKKLPQLEELDISNNYVTDIKDLLKLKHLKKLNCTGNQISNLDLLPESVKVTM